jgi:bile acid:Na+ symporter, BASS family
LLNDVPGLLVIKDVTLVLFIVSTMLSIGLSVNLKQIKTTISNYKLMTKGLLANFLIIPLVAWIIVQVIPMEESISIGFLLVSVCAGAALGPKFAQISKSDIALAATMMFILSALTALVTPLWLDAFFGSAGDSADSAYSAGFSTPTIDTSRIIIELVILYLIPMVFGILINNRYPDRAKIRTLLEKVSTILLILVAVIVLVTNLSDIYHYVVGITGIIISIVSVMIYGTLGYILGGPRIPTKRSLVFDTAVRNDAIALLIATQSFSDHPNVAVVVVVFGLTQIIIMGIIAYYWSKKSKGSESINVNTK